VSQSEQGQPSRLPVLSREVLAWMLYDWANSAYSTLLITVVVYYLQKIVLPGTWGAVVYAWGISAAMLITAVLSPIVGAMADANRSKRRWLGGLALAGAGVSILMACLPTSQMWLIVGCFVLSALCFNLSLVPYNGFLPEIANEKTMNRVSAWGFALGYLGGAIPLLLAGGLIMAGPRMGLEEATALRAGVLLMGLWWGGFTLPVVWILRDRGEPPARRQPLLRAAAAALGEVGHTLASVRALPVLAFFLVAFLFYNDGVETLITQASTLAIQSFQFSPSELFLLVLIIQLVALPGAMAVGWLSDRLGQKRTLVGCLAVWVVLPIAAALLTERWSFWALGAVLALVLGGTQSVSRAIMGLITPPARTAEFFGFFNLSGKAAAFMGPTLFGLVMRSTEDARLASLSVVIFFVIGWLLVMRVDVDEGRRQALGEDAAGKPARYTVPDHQRADVTRPPTPNS